ncbi:Alpha/Beta hydrolase protein [Ilyonectria destructans]|nr:Alpha/Beta hydrolase protein [Ilyonectria destructans]
MTAPGGQYFIHDQLDKHQPHHESFQRLWETRWGPLARNMTYPFLYTDKRDFDPIVEEMARLGVKEPYEWQSFALMFDSHASKLFETASAAEQARELEKASEFYLRASNVCDSQRNAWERSKTACLKGLQLRGIPIHEHLVPHTHGLESEGRHVPIWSSLPDGASKEHPAPIVLGMGVPGTGDSPALADDPLSPDRQWSSLLDWIDGHEAIDSQRVVGWGVSTGGYYATRVAYTHHEKFLGVVSHGGASHYSFDPKWLENIDRREFAHSASEAFAWKWGFKGDISRLIEEASDKFSLLKDGTLDKTECARLLLVNGIDDSIFPVDDSYLCLEHGPPKEAKFFRDKSHMGGKASYGIIIAWILKVLGSDIDFRHVMGEMAYTPKY